MIQKVLKVGSSAAVTIPKGSLKELGLAIGDQVNVIVDKKSKRMVIEAVANDVDREVTWPASAAIWVTWPARSRGSMRRLSCLRHTPMRPSLLRP